MVWSLIRNLCFVLSIWLRKIEKERLGGGVMIPLYKAFSTISLSLQLNLQVKGHFTHPPFHPVPFSTFKTPFFFHSQLPPPPFSFSFSLLLLLLLFTFHLSTIYIALTHLSQKTSLTSTISLSRI